jgi:hypothetical protein
MLLFIRSRFLASLSCGFYEEAHERKVGDGRQEHFEL